MCSDFPPLTKNYKERLPNKDLSTVPYFAQNDKAAPEKHATLIQIGKETLCQHPG
jgi:hypothetical protein